MKRIITKITRRSTDWGWRVIIDGDEAAGGATETFSEAAIAVSGCLEEIAGEVGLDSSEGTVVA